ncbi:amino acid ABC transporter permease [Anaerotignum sp. MSJ-24]|uniref:amino acid ABC transporter permease n=1 Tax=Anaerotignum sp. MSJ-24 TaxID=2841521 RepID=UPI0020A0C72E|nr:amino acid ABC transporter permease [Anaerotignum sp. MSJ-24]
MTEWINSIKAQFVLNFIEGDRWKLLVSGLGVTLKITLIAMVLGIVIGVILATIRSTYDLTKDDGRGGFGRVLLKIFNVIAKIYLTIIRGTPVVIQLLIIYFVIFASSDNGVLIAALAFGMNSGAYVAEIIRAGIMSIDRGQMEAGRSLGFNYIETMRYIIIPQAFKNVLPSLANEFIALLKETSVAGYAAIQDLTRAGNIIRSKTFSAFMPLVAVALIYLAMVMILTYFVGRLERRLRNSER